MSRSTPLPERPEHIEVPIGSAHWALRMIWNGWRVRRKSWPASHGNIAFGQGINLTEDDLDAEDWKLVK